MVLCCVDYSLVLAVVLRTRRSRERADLPLARQVAPLLNDDRRSTDRVRANAACIALIPDSACQLILPVTLLASN